MKYLTRLTHNSSGWHYPSGPAYKSSNHAAFEGVYDFGFEEWLFCEKHRIDGHQYGYVEGLNSLFGKAHIPKIPLILFTLQYTYNRRGRANRSIVAEIKEWEFLSDWKLDVADANLQQSWYNGMLHDLTNVLPPQKLVSAQQQVGIHYNVPANQAKPLFNLKFSLSSGNVERGVKHDIDISTLNYFKLYQTEL